MSNNAQTKILYAVTKSNFGGAQRYVYDLASNLRQSYTPGCDVVVAAGGSGTLFEKCQQVGIQTRHLQSAQRDIHIRKEITLASELLGLYLKEQPDIIHLNSTKVGGLGAFVGRIWWCITLLLAPLSLLPSTYSPPSVPKIIFTAHGWAFKEDRFGRTFSYIFFLLQAVTVMLAHTTIAVSKHTKREMTDRAGFLERKIAVIHNGIESFHTNDTAEARTELTAHIDRPMPESAQWLGTIAELHQNKGLDTAIEAVAQVQKNEGDNEFAYLIIGEGEEKEVLEKKVHEHNLADTVYFTGYIPNARKLLQAFDIFLLPSRKEGFPYTLLEAGIAARATIASDVGGISEIIQDNDTGILVPPNQPTQLASALANLLDAPETQTSLGNALQSQVENTFLQESMIKKTTDVYTR